MDPETIGSEEWARAYRGRVHCTKCGVERITDPTTRAGVGWPMHCGLKMAEGCAPGDALPRGSK